RAPRSFLRIGLRNLRHGFAGALGLGAKMVASQSFAQEFDSRLGRVHDLYQVQVLGRDGARIHKRLKVDDLVPILAAVNQYQNLLGQLLGLSKGQDFEQFIHGSKAAREDHQGLGEVREPEFTHEEIMKLEVQRRRDVRVRVLLERKMNVQTDGLALGFMGAEVGGFHDAGAASGGNDETVPPCRNLG